MKSIFASILLALTLSSQASSAYHLKCTNTDAYTDLGPSTLELETTITVHGENDYSLKGGNFKFTIDEDWTDQNIEIDIIRNYQNYRPRVYKDHAKFADFAKGFFGLADLIIPHSDLLEGSENFQAHLILSWVDDHWGGTISADCKMTPLQ